MFRINNPEHFLFTWSGHLFRIGRNFDRRQHGTVHFTFYQFVHSTQRWLVRSGNQLCADTPCINPCSLCLQVENRIFIQIIGCYNFHIIQASLIQHLTCLNGQVRKVTAVQTNRIHLFALAL
ncbi:hypothetical protein D3C74_409610 [compost metagenome]